MDKQPRPVNSKGPRFWVIRLIFTMSNICFHCIQCGASLTAGSRSEHFTKCSACLHVVPVPSESAVADGPSEMAFPKGVLELEMKFLCTSCGVRLGIDARWEGRSITCPKCNCSTEIPRWSQRRESKPAPSVVLTADEVAFLSADDDNLQTA